MSNFWNRPGRQGEELANGLSLSTSASCASVCVFSAWEWVAVEGSNMRSRTAKFSDLVEYNMIALPHVAA